MNKSKYKLIEIIAFLILGITLILFIISMIKAFNEWSKPPIADEPHVLGMLKDNKKEFSDIVAYVQSINEDIVIEKEGYKSYKAKKHGGVEVEDTKINDKDIDDNKTD